MKKHWRILLSLALLVPGRLLSLLFVVYFEALTGQLALGYGLGCILFGTLASLPVTIPVWRRPMTVGQKLVRTLPLVCIYAGILLLGGVSLGRRSPV
ncbi:MAG: hypothetical protein IKB09_07015 [Oscillospiraceae bacterium]|nr:hypothetical protein [Oscillospiraceae bacterium]